MRFSEEQIRDIVKIKEDLIKQIESHQEAIGMLEKNLEILDMALKESSFTKASQLGKASRPAKEAPPSQTGSTIPIKQGNTDRVIADAHVTAEQISITLKDDVRVSQDTPPFRSFFLGRIIEEMRKKDEAAAANGTVQEVIECTVNNDGSDIREIIIRNYNQKERVTELVNTAGWSLSRMLEKVG